MREEELKAALQELQSGVLERDQRHASAIEALQTKLKTFEARANREQLGLGGNGERLSGSRMEGCISQLSADERKGLEHVFRGGDPREVKLLTSVSGLQGGYLAPESLANEIARIARPLTPLRQLAKVIPNASANLVLPVATGGGRHGLARGRGDSL